ncbi:MAG: hypothetical protein V3S69_01435 [Dehalococcoidales bacterium]
MNAPVTQLNPEQARAQRQIQINTARAVNGMKEGLEFLIDDSVIGPIKYAEGLADLKWLLRGVLGGQFGLNLEPQAAPVAAATGKALSEYDEDKKPDAEANGEGK